MQENVQSAIHASIMEMGDILGQRIACQNPLLHNSDTEEGQNGTLWSSDRHGAQCRHNRQQVDDMDRV